MVTLIKNPPAVLLDSDGDLDRDASFAIEVVFVPGTNEGTARLVPARGGGCHMCGLDAALDQ
ncbi:MAG: hypothetical protein A2Y38_17075 [Spirochaetes bacterium GWB1_59_5]|nr:MAG: hypothetical protein A2Y38_17075 [Spirochaetes bacterium GWB1_59_5]